jgi:PAS domain S-box-containing protein
MRWMAWYEIAVMVSVTLPIAYGRSSKIGRQGKRDTSKQMDKVAKKTEDGLAKVNREMAGFEASLLKAGALQRAIFNSANFSSIATDEKGVIQIFNVGAERMLGYAAHDVVGTVTPADISDPQEVIARATTLSQELETNISPGFEALVFKASRGIEDIYELTYIRKDGSRFPAVVSVTALRDAEGGIIGYLLIGTDNTARKQAEEALLKAGALQRAIFNSANFSSIATDEKGVIQIFNVGAERMLGYAAHDVVGTVTPADISDPQEVITRATTLSRELETNITPGFEALVFKASRGIEDIYELTYIRKDGSRFPAVVSVTALRDAEGGIIGYLLIGTDNTARKQAEEALLKAGALQRAIFNSANFSSIATDEKGVIQIFNVGAERMLGYAAHDVVGTVTPADISDPQEVITRATTLSRELETNISPGFEALVFKASRGIEDIYELTYIRRDGSRFPAVVSVTALRDAEDGIIGYLLIGTDNTARKQAQTNEALLAAIIASSDDAIISETLQGVITTWNRGAERLFGYSAAEIIGREVSLLFPKEMQWEDEKRTLERLQTSGTSEYFETIRLHKNGQPIQVSLTMSRVWDANGETIGASKVLRDITERKLNRELERVASDADAANRAKSMFLSTMSHEIRTPLNAILGYVQLMSRDDGLGSNAKANLKIIGRSGEHLLTLLNNVLDMSKIEAGHMELHPTTFNLSVLLEDLASMFRLRAEAKALGFEMSLHGESLTYVVGDAVKIRQVLINLIGNAIKFTRQGQIKLQIEVKQRHDNQLWLSCQVEDTGPGISAEEQKALFEVFSQNANSFNIVEGSGLGLVISRNFARLMGGDVTVNSSPGKGSIFLLEFPIERGDARVVFKRAAPRHVTGLRHGTKVPKILVVDDQLENRDWLMKLLTVIGFLVRGSENGEVALRDWAEWNPRLILMDLHMPVMNGIEATQIIKADPRGKETKIVVLTASAMGADFERVHEVGADDFLVKPCREEELLEKMGTHLNIDYNYDDVPLDPNAATAGMMLSAERLGQLPRELIEELRKATANGNKKILNRLLLTVRDTEAFESASALQALADKYEYDTLTRVLGEASHQ